jgi:hypothetical protein
VAKPVEALDSVLITVTFDAENMPVISTAGRASRTAVYNNEFFGDSDE